MGLTNFTVSFTGDTAAYADENAVIDGGEKVNISATQLTKVDYGTVAGAVGGTASLSGTVGVNALKTTTKAYAAASSRRRQQTQKGSRSRPAMRQRSKVTMAACPSAFPVEARVQPSA